MRNQYDLSYQLQQQTAPQKKRYLDFLADSVPKDSNSIYKNRANKHAQIFISRFHFQMEFLTMEGRLICKDIFGFFGQKWRESDLLFNWITTICDPNHALFELLQYLLCYY